MEGTDYQDGLSMRVQLLDNHHLPFPSFNHSSFRDRLSASSTLRGHVCCKACSIDMEYRYHQRKNIEMDPGLDWLVSQPISLMGSKVCL